MSSTLYALAHVSTFSGISITYTLHYTKHQTSECDRQLRTCVFSDQHCMLSDSIVVPEVEEARIAFYFTNLNSWKFAEANLFKGHF